MCGISGMFCTKFYCSSTNHPDFTCCRVISLGICSLLVTILMYCTEVLYFYSTTLSFYVIFPCVLNGEYVQQRVRPAIQKSQSVLCKQCLTVVSVVILFALLSRYHHFRGSVHLQSLSWRQYVHQKCWYLPRNPHNYCLQDQH